MAKRQSGTENINHYASYRVRVVGTGNFKSTIFDLAGNSKALANIAMENPARIEPLRIVNFISQRARIQFETEVINDFFKLYKIVVFIKPIFQQYPT